MGYSLVTFDAGLALLEGFFHFFPAAPRLLVKGHGLVGMAIAAFLGITFLHGGPDIFRQFHALGFEFLTRVDGAEKFVNEFIAGLDFAHQLSRPFLRHMTVRTDHPDAGGVFVMN